jgi:predicted SnoaL-like aldol condensation-catalyzing enzyme
MTAIEVVRFKDGKAVEHWSFMEPREMMKMMAQQPPADKKKK